MRNRGALAGYLLLTLSSVAAAAPAALHHVQGFVGQMSDQKFGSSVIAADGTSLDMEEDSAALAALSDACAPNQWCRVSGWVQGKRTLVLLEAAQVVNEGTAVAAAVPDVVATPAFDCGKAETAVELLICHSTELAGLDVQLADRYRAARAQGSAVAAQQSAWLKRRNACGSAKCVHDAYIRRIGELGGTSTK